MIKALFTAATGMRAQQRRIDVIANNLANVNTTGFKKSQVNFEDLLYNNIEDAGSTNSSGSLRPSGLQIGSGTRLVSTSKVFTTGNLEETGSPLDLVISGQGFFQVEDLSGNIVFTRDGNFKPDALGNLVNSQGLKLSPGITVPPQASVSVDQSGAISAAVGNAPATNIGNVQIANFPNPAGLEALGGNLLKETVASGAAVLGNPGDEGFGSILSSFLERSNVEVVSELVNLIVSQRAYETNSRAISAADEMLTTANQIIR